MMTFSLYLVLSLFCVGAWAEATLQKVVSPLPRAHSHNDYEHPHPLQDALDQGFCSVEADIWLVDGAILVSHNIGGYKGSLKDLYLDPLQQRVSEKGSVYGDGTEFLLWVDIKDGNPELNEKLEELLSKYPMLSVFTESDKHEGAVTVILTGDATSKKRHLEAFKVSHACRDAGYSPEDPPSDGRWNWIAIPWSSVSGWRGGGVFSVPVPTDDRKKLVDLIEDVHRKGRRIRIWGNPDEISYWQLALETGIDLINTDRLVDLGEFLRGRSEKKE